MTASFRWTLWVGLACAALAAGCGGRRAAVAGMHGGGANFDSIALYAGFMPDPQALRGRSGGRVDARRLGGGCVGWMSQNPDHIVSLTTPFNFFRVFVRAQQDTTLIIQRPDGGYYCDDDSGGDLDPMIEAGYWPPGDYAVWVGSFQQGVYSDYQIYFTELPHVM